MKINVVKKKNPLAKAFADTLNSIEGQIDYRKSSIVEELLQFMKLHNIKRSELAERMGVVPGRVTKLLNGTENLTIETLVRAGRAVGADLVQTFVPQGQKGHWVGLRRPENAESNYTKVYFSRKTIRHAPMPRLETTQPAERDAEYAA
ncbi:MAG: helix-turn-helix domain-containing protein [Opitutales bacterium]|nr:helix-turn-helix domain-containing protein [Opitutales bacterium]